MAHENALEEIARLERQVAGVHRDALSAEQRRLRDEPDDAVRLRAAERRLRRLQHPIGRLLPAGPAGLLGAYLFSPTVGLALGAALAGSAAAAPAPATEPVVVLAYADGARVCRAPVSADAMGVPACVPTPAVVSAIAWRDGGDVAVALDDGRRAGVVTASGFAKLAVPAASVWTAPKPRRAGVPLGPGTAWRLVVADGGAVWLGRCAWVSLVDVPVCVAWRFARLDGPSAVQGVTPAQRPSPIPPVAAPHDTTVAAAVEPDGALRVRCRRGAETSTFVVPPVDGATSSAGIVWAAADPPVYLVEVEDDFIEAQLGRTFLGAACRPDVEALPTQPEDGPILGPRSVFIVRADSAWVVHVGARVVARLPDGPAPVFLPLGPAAAPVPAAGGDTAALGLYPVVVDGRSGFMDRVGRTAVAAVYDEVSAFADGRALVELGATARDGAKVAGTYGFVDPHGALVIPAIYTWARSFSEGRAVVEIDRRKGYIDADGKLVVPARYVGRAEDFHGGLAAVETAPDRWAFIDRDGRTAFELPADADMSDPARFSDGLAAVRVSAGTRFYDARGQVVAEIAQRITRDFSEGLIAVRDADGRWGYMDRTGRWVLAPAWQRAEGFHAGRAVVVQRDARSALIDRAGRALWSVPAGDTLDVPSEGLIGFERDGKLGFLDAATGHEAIGPLWDAPADSLRRMTGGVAMIAVRKEGALSLGYIDRAGAVIRPVAPARWRPARPR